MAHGLLCTFEPETKFHMHTCIPRQIKSVSHLKQESDVAAELVVAHVLLGAPAAAARLLHGAAQSGGSGSADSSAANGQQRPEATAGEVLAYVRGASSEGDADLLPGLVVFTEAWLARVCPQNHSQLLRRGCVNEFSALSPSHPAPCCLHKCMVCMGV